MERVIMVLRIYNFLVLPCHGNFLLCGRTN
jgi:hypothetical protein